ncbi:MAG: hypothetical protein Kow0099_17800 [Candidatus Abyssubacteria bacterium]
MQWYYVLGKERIGPVEEEEFRSLVSTGTIRSETLVWRKGMTQWQRYRDVSWQGGSDGSATADVATERYACRECGQYFPADEMVPYGSTYVCATCKPVFFQRIKEGAPLRSAMVYGGFWTRFLAKAIDWSILLVINWAVGFAFMLPMMRTMQNSQGAPPPGFFMLQMLLSLFQIVIGASYTTFFLGKFAATPGKMACKLKVVTSDGGRVSYLRALGRHFAEMLSSIILLIGYIMAAFDEQKRTLHDRICDTRVIKK